MTSRAAAVFLATRPDALEPDVVARDLDARIEEGRAAWPSIAIDEEAFARWLGSIAPPSVPVTDLRGANLHLAFACAQGFAPALALFEERYFGYIPLALRRIGLDGLDDNLAQLLRVKLFFPGAGATPAIAKYGGRVDLKAWFRVVSLRTALNLRRAKAPEIVASFEESAALVTADPELSHLRERYRADFVAAFEGAVAELEPKDRHILSLHYVDRVSIDEIGTIHRIHRATAARRLVRAREVLIERTRAVLAERLQLSATELESLLRLLRSAVEIDLAPLLRDAEKKT